MGSDPRQTTFLQLPLARSSESSSPIINNHHHHVNQHSSSHEEEEPLDLSVPGKASCSDCKELRREVREVKNSVQFLIQQFSDFTGRISNAIAPKAPVVSSAQRSSPVSSVSSTESSGPKDDGSSGKMRDISPESASSSHDSSGVHAKKRKAGPKIHKANKKLMSSPSPKPSESALPSLRIKDISDTPIIPEIKRPKTEPLASGTSSACPLPVYPHHSSIPPPLSQHPGASSAQNWQLPPSLVWNSPGWNPLLRQAYDSPEFRRHIEHSGVRPQMGMGGMGSPSPPSSGGGIPSPSSSSGLSQAQLEAVIKNVVAMQQHKRDMEAQKYHQQQMAAASKDEVPLAADVSSMRGTDPSKSPSVENHLDALAHQHPLPIKKRPGPDDFIKEFVEQEAFFSDDTERSYQIPVPEALECDPNFRPVSEEALLCSTRWEELDWQEAVTRLSKKLAEKRVFGPLLMAKATVAGTNHSNYPNLPIQGIMYIESVCRRVLFPGLKRREFAEFFRPAVKGLAARCRRIRHSMKPGGGVDPSAEDLYSPGDDDPTSSSSNAGIHNHVQIVDRGV